MKLRKEAMKKRKIRWLFVGVGLLVLFFVILGIRFGSVGAAIAWLDGEAIYLTPKTVHLPDRKGGAEESVMFHLRNLTGKEITIIGQRVSCSCAMAEDLPLRIGPNKVVDLRVRVQFPRDEATYDQSIRLMVEVGEKLRLSDIRITATIADPISEPDVFLPELEEKSSDLTVTPE